MAMTSRTMAVMAGIGITGADSIMTNSGILVMSVTRSMRNTSSIVDKLAIVEALPIAAMGSFF